VPLFTLVILVCVSVSGSRILHGALRRSRLAYIICDLRISLLLNRLNRLLRLLILFFHY
jgi:hypothetical protein